MWKNNARGVDINRNFLSKSWKPKSIDDKPMSEVETTKTTTKEKTGGANK